MRNDDILLIPNPIYDVYIEEEYIREFEDEVNEKIFYKKEFEESKKELLSQKDAEIAKHHQQMLDLAKMLKSLNVSVEIIVGKTGLSQQEIENL